MQIVNHDDSQYGDGWSLSYDQRLMIQDGLSGQADGVALVTGHDQVVWFSESGGVYTRMHNPYDFSKLEKQENGAGETDDTYTLTDPSSTVRTFDYQGFLQTIVDRNGNALATYTYGTGGDSDKIVDIEDQSGRHTHFEYDDGLLVGITDFYGTAGAQTTEYTYYPSTNQLYQMIEPDPDGAGPLSSPITTYHYDATTGLLDSVINPRGLETTIAYDDLRRVSAITEPDEGVIDITSLQSLVTVDLATTGYDENHLADLLPYHNAYNQSYGLYTFDQIEELFNGDLYDDPTYETRDVFGQQTKIIRDRFGSVSSMQDANGTVTWFKNDPFTGLPYQVIQTDPNNPSGTLTTSYTHDGYGRVTHISYPGGLGTESWSYGPFGQVSYYIDPSGKQTSYNIDAGNGNILSMTQGSGAQAATTNYTYTDQYDGTLLGLVETITDANGNVTRYQYNAQGLVELITYAENTADETTVEYEYDSRDRVKVMIDGLGRRTDYAYDNLDRLIQQTDPDPDGAGPQARPVWKFKYDSNDNLIQQTDPLGNVTDYEFDDRDRLSLVTEPDPDGAGPLARPETEYVFDPHGNLTSVTDALGHTTAYEYDELDRLIQRTEPNPGSGSPVTHYFYNELSWLTSMVDAEGNATIYQYDAMGRQTKEFKVLEPGLTGEYRSSGGTLLHTRVDSQVNFSPSANFAGYSDLGNGFTATWTGAIYLDDPGEVEFFLNNTDYAQLYLDGSTTAMVSNYNYSSSMVEQSGSVELAAGWHTIKITFQDAYTTGNSGLIVSYTPVGGSKQVIPTNALMTTQITTATQYDNAGRVTETVDAMGRGTKYTYDTLGRMTKAASIIYNGSSYTYVGPETNYTYDDASNLLTVTDALNHTTTYTYDALNRVKTVENPNGELTSYSYDAVGNLLALTDPELNTTTWVYDDLNRVIEETNELNATRYFQYDAVGNLTRAIDRNGRITRYGYDNLYRQTEETWQEDGVAPEVKGRYVFYNNSAYDGDNLAANSDDDDAIAPDKTALLPGETATAANVTNYTLGLNGLMIDILEVGTLTTSDFIFKVGDSQDPASWSAVNLANVSISVREDAGKDGSDRVTILFNNYEVKDEWLQVTVKANANTGLSTPDVFYFANLSGDYDYDYDVDGADFVVWQTFSGPVDITTGPDGDRNGAVDGSDFVIWQTIFPHTMTQLAAPADVARTIQYEFDELGRLLEVTDRDGNNDPAGADYSYAYDNLNRVTNIEQTLVGLTPMVEFEFAYDALSRRLVQYSTIGGTANFLNAYAYDALGRLTIIGQLGNAVAQKRFDFTYNPAGQLDTIASYANTAGTQNVGSRTYGYDNAGRLTGLTYASSIGSFSYGWQWDAANRITAMTNSLYPSENVTYDYDDAGQLTDADRSGTANDEGYDYDDNGNRTNTGYVTGANNRLLSDGTFSYQYDGEGNLIKRTHISSGFYTVYQWDHRNRLVSVSEHEDDHTLYQKVTYTYDAFDRLIGKQVDDNGNGTIDRTEAYVYDGDQIVLRFADDDAAALAASDLANRYLWGPAVDMLLAQEDVTSLTTAGDVLWALTDHQNTVRDWAKYNSGSGTTSLVGHNKFDTFGNLLNAAAVDSVFGYTARYFDPDTGLQWNGSGEGGGRWYDSATGRWLSEDSIKDGVNWYAYVRNTPTIYVDPNGMEPPRDGGPFWDPRPPRPKPSIPAPTSGGTNVAQKGAQGALVGAATVGKYLTWPARWFGADFSRQDAFLDQAWDELLNNEDRFTQPTTEAAAGTAAAASYGAAGLGAVGRAAGREAASSGQQTSPPNEPIIIEVPPECVPGWGLPSGPQIPPGRPVPPWQRPPLPPGGRPPGGDFPPGQWPWQPKPPGGIGPIRPN